MANTDIANRNNESNAPAQKPKTLKELMASAGVMNKIKEVMGNERMAASFASSVLSIANGNYALRNADPMTVVGASMVAATLQLPIVPSLGLAYIVPYNDPKTRRQVAQFQLGYKGLIELAERTGQFRNIIDEVVYEGQLVKKNKFTGEYVFDEDAKKSDKVIGYMCRMDLVNGFSKTIYWTIDEVKAHATKFSQAYKKGWTSPWSTDFDAMARKTVLKALFSKYAPKSILMQNAMTYDQGVVTAKVDSGEGDEVIIDITPEYIDNPSGQVTDTGMADKIKEAAKAKFDKVEAAMKSSKKADGVTADPDTGEVIEDNSNESK